MARDWYSKLLNRLNLSGKDLAWFLLCLLLAFSIWLIHNMSADYDEVLNVPVVARCNIEGHSELSSNTVTISARCHASGFSLMRKVRNWSRQTVVVFFDASDFDPVDEVTYKISSDYLGKYDTHLFGSDVVVESYNSRSYSFRFPVENHKKVPVKAVHHLTFRPQYTSVSPMAVSPDSVILYGEPSVVDPIECVYTQEITREDIKDDFSGSVSLVPVSKVRLSQEAVDYSIDVGRYVEISVPDVKVIPRNVPVGKSLSVYPSRATVVFRCIFPVVETPSADSGFSCAVDYNDYAASVNGRCIGELTKVPAGVIDYLIYPQVFECIELVDEKASQGR